ncbi:MAG: hypothetical protein CML93_03515 [Rhodobiaceae bacterium]|nr:hypothetical protein [Rhodobiaceae bacterium]
MASIIRIKRSSGTSKPSSLNWGEMAYVTGIGSYGGTNQYKDRVFLGDDGTNVNPIGGHYYTSMMEHTPGNLTGVTNSRNSDGGIVPVLDSSKKIDEWNVDNLRLDGNQFSSTNTDGDIVFNPNGSGDIMVPDDTKIAFGGGINGIDAPQAFIRYDEVGDDHLEIGSDVDSVGKVKFTNATQATNTSDGSVVFAGGISVAKNAVVGGDLIVSGGNTKLGNIRIENNIIASLAGADNTIFIDPYPDGLSNEGNVIIKGNLQVDGTTTTVNSTQSTVNDPIMTVGDVTSSRTVFATIASGVSTAILDDVTGIAQNDLVQGTGLPNSGLTTITSINTGVKMITFTGTTTSGISTGAQFTITHATDTNTDRGLSFKYNTGIGTANTSEGFFGLDDSSIAASTAGTGNHGTHADDSRRWTYVPDATISASVVTGTKGFLDVKGLYYQSGNFSTGGVVWFDDKGLQRSTNAPASPIDTSKQILTAVTKVVLTMPGNVTLAKGDIIKQASTNAFGVVESAVNAGTSVPLIGVEGTFNNSNTLVREGQSGGTSNLAAPSSVATTYVNKPHWTSTLDGGTF